MLDKILGFIANKLHTKIGAFTRNSGWTGDEIEVKQYGDVVMVKGYFTRSGGTGTNEIAIGNISGVSLPTSHVRFRVGAGNAAYNATISGYGILAKSGQLSVKLPSSQTTVTIALVYISWGGVLLNPHFSTFTAIFRKIGGGLDVGQDISVYPLRNGIRVQSPHKLFDRHKHYDQSETIQTRRFGCSNILLDKQLEVHCMDVRSSGQFDKLKDLNTVQQLQRTDRNERDRRYRISDLCWLQNVTTSERGWAVC